MAWCPECRYEFVDGVKECPKCHVALVESLSAKNAEDDLSANEVFEELSEETDFEELEYSAEIDPDRPTLSRHARAQIAVEIKYSGYIDKQRDQVERFKKLEDRRLPEDLDYLNMKGLRIEAAQKLDAERPESLGRASRISGVSPADINVLLVHLEKERRKK